MTTLAALKALIADDLKRSDLTGQIAAGITSAIEFYQPRRFYFNETRDSTFVTVADQSRYTSSDDTDIPKWVKLDDMFLEDSSSIRYCLARVSPIGMEHSLDASAATGRPSEYAYYQQSFWLYPIPDAVYTVRPMGVIKKDAPASDSETDNVWMTDGFELIRCAAKRYIGMHTIIDPQLLNNASAGEQVALQRLTMETSMKVGSGIIEPTIF